MFLSSRSYFSCYIQISLCNHIFKAVFTILLEQFCMLWKLSILSPDLGKNYSLFCVWVSCHCWNSFNVKIHAESKKKNHVSFAVGLLVPSSGQHLHPRELVWVKWNEDLEQSVLQQTHGMISFRCQSCFCWGKLLWVPIYLTKHFTFNLRWWKD